MGYDGNVTRLSRLTSAAALTVALGTVPLIADWCAAICESAHASATTGAPACHHSGSTASRIGEAPRPCSHDHHPAVVDAATTFAVATRVLMAVPSVTIHAYDSSSIWVALRDSSIPGDAASSPLALALASSLRI
jgi:hypothetical protein